VRIALVSEGITDFDVLKTAIDSMLKGRSFDLKLLQPEGSVAFTGAGNAGAFGGGWKGVYKWCLQAALRGGGALRGDPLFISYDLLVLHLDADVAHEDPANDAIDPLPNLIGLLPCERPCPPASATTEALRLVILSWVGEAQIPPRTVLCTPSKSTEAWVMASLFPKDKEMTKMGWECHPSPGDRLAPAGRLAGERLAKRHADYEARASDLRLAWPNISGKLSEAMRFQNEFISAVRNLPAE
jgi:hypothetical protein